VQTADAPIRGRPLPSLSSAASRFAVGRVSSRGCPAASAACRCASHPLPGERVAPPLSTPAPLPPAVSLFTPAPPPHTAIHPPPRAGLFSTRRPPEPAASRPPAHTTPPPFARAATLVPTGTTPPRQAHAATRPPAHTTPPRFTRTATLVPTGTTPAAHPPANHRSIPPPAGARRADAVTGPWRRPVAGIAAGSWTTPDLPLYGNDHDRSDFAP
jgi:hypothetical protein